MLISCRLCEFETKENTKYYNHIDLWHTVTKESIKCQYCDFSANTKHDVKSHLELEHRPYQCDICCSKLSDAKQLRWHKFRIHDVPLNKVEDSVQRKSKRLKV